MKNICRLLITVGVVLSNWELTEAASFPAFVEAFFDNALCSGTPSLTPPTGTSLEAVLIGFCYYSASTGVGSSELSEETVYNVTTNIVSIRSFTSKACSGSPIALSVTDIDLSTEPCVDVGGGQFRKRIVTDVPSGGFAGVASWVVNDIPGATSSTCFPEIADLPPPQAGSASGSHFLAGSCVQLPNSLFRTISFTSSSATFADVATHQTSDCTGAGTPAIDCLFIPEFNRTLFVGDLSELTPFPTSSPSSSPTDAPTISPSTSPTRSPTTSPTAAPSGSPTNLPTDSPVTPNPTRSPVSSAFTIKCFNPVLDLFVAALVASVIW